MVQLTPLHPKIPSSLASFKSRLVLPFSGCPGKEPLVVVVIQVLLVLQHSSGDLKVVDGEGFFVDIGGVGAAGEGTHSRQVAAVAAHCLNHKHTRLGAGRRLTNPV